MLGVLEGEAGSIVTLSQRLNIVDSASEILEVNPSKCVCFSGVATDVEELGILKGCGREIEVEVRNSVLIPIARLYQLSGMRSLPSVQVKLPGSPVIEKNDFMTSPSRYPSGYSSDLLDINL